MKHQKRILSLLLAILMLTTTLFATGCDAINLLLDNLRGQETEGTTPESTTPENTTPEATTPEATTPEDEEPVTPPVFEGIEFSDPAVVIPAAYALANNASMDGTHTLMGQIIEAGKYNADSKDMIVTIVVPGYEEYPLYCYYLKNCTPEVGVGDYVAVQGKIKNYKGTIEFDKPTMLAHAKGTLAPSIDIEPKPGTGLAQGYDVITVEQAIEIAKIAGETPTTERYYILATIATVTNGVFGEMYIEDATGSISVYGTYSEDGSIGYKDMTDKPTKGDLVLLSCTLQNFKGEAEVKNARLVKFEKVQLDESLYTEMTLANARNAQKGDLVKVTGVVAQITYASGKVPNGVYLVDGTNSIYVFDSDLAGSVSVGNTVTILAEKDWWILDTEVSHADKFGYKGCNQLTNAWLFANDGGNSEPDYSWVTETTVKNIMDTPFTTDITTTVYKVTALVKEAIGQGFINYYINDLDGVTGSYVYTQCDGGDLDWLKEFDGKFCTVYLSVINAKSTATGCVWRFKVLKVVDEGFTFDKADAPQFAIDYEAADQFEPKYTTDPALELLTTVSSELLGFENVLLTYSSDNTDIVYFETVDGKVIMHCGTTYGTANVTITATLDGVTATKTVAIENAEPPKFNFITVADAINAADDTIITVKGIVGPSLVNRNGFYLFGEDGSMIAIIVNSVDTLKELKVGNEIILQGRREQFVKEENKGSRFGQSSIVEAEVLMNYYGNHEYSTAKFITDKTIAEVLAYPITEDHTTEVYVFTGTLSFPTSWGQPAITDANGNTITFYSSGSGQYSFLKDYEGQVVTLEIAPCNWNDKTHWTGCVLAIRLADGTKIVNTLNFN